MEFFLQFKDLLTGALGPFGPLIVVGVLGAILIAGAVLLILNAPKDPMAKLAEKENGQGEETKTQKTRLRSRQDKDKLQKYSSLLEPQDEESYSAARLKLLQAGYRSKGAVRLYHFLQFALGIAGLILGTAYTVLNGALSSESMTMQQQLMYIMLPGGLGYMGPKYWVNKRQAARQKAIIEGFPDSLDMMLICVEAGQSLDWQQQVLS